MTTYTINGQSVRSLCNARGISFSTINKRILAGMSPEEALNKPVRAKKGSKLDSKLFIHNCPECKFLGSHNYRDLYICHGNHGHLPGIWMIAREGNDPLDYSAARYGYAYNYSLETIQKLIGEL